jgi:hypothetical protein
VPGPLQELVRGAPRQRIVRCASPINRMLQQGGKTVYSKGSGPSIGPWTTISIGYLGVGHGRGRPSSHHDVTAGIPFSWWTMGA